MMDSIFLRVSSKPPAGPFTEPIILFRASCCNTLAVNATGESILPAISFNPERRPSREATATNNVALIAYSQALENIGYGLRILYRRGTDVRITDGCHAGFASPRKKIGGFAFRRAIN